MAGTPVILFACTLLLLPLTALPALRMSLPRPSAEAVAFAPSPKQHARMSRRMALRGGAPAGKAPAAEKRERDADGEKPAAKKKRGGGGGWFHAQRPPPPRHGEKPIPRGTSTCLAGMQIVITGVLESLDRDEATHLCQRHGAKVVSGVSGKLTHALVGEDAGPAKLAQLSSLPHVQILSEDDLLGRIRAAVGEGPGGEAVVADDGGTVDAEEATAGPSFAGPVCGGDQEARAAGGAERAGGRGGGFAARALWVEKYRPKRLSEIVGHKAQVGSDTWQPRCIHIIVGRRRKFGVYRKPAGRRFSPANLHPTP